MLRNFFNVISPGRENKTFSYYVFSKYENAFTAQRVEGWFWEKIYKIGIALFRVTETSCLHKRFRTSKCVCRYPHPVYDILGAGVGRIHECKSPFESDPLKFGNRGWYRTVYGIWPSVHVRSTADFSIYTIFQHQCIAWRIANRKDGIILPICNREKRRRVHLGTSLNIRTVRSCTTGWAEMPYATRGRSRTGEKSERVSGSPARMFYTKTRRPNRCPGLYNCARALASIPTTRTVFRFIRSTALGPRFTPYAASQSDDCRAMRWVIAIDVR